MEKQQNYRRQTGIPGLVALLFLLGGSLSAQTVVLSITGDRFTVGEKVTFELRIQDPDPTRISLPPLSLPANLSLLAGPFLKPAVWKVQEGQVTGTLSTYTLRVNSDGIVEIGPFTVRIAGQEYRSGTQTLYLLKADEAGRRYPLEYSWSVPPGPYYEAQALPLTFFIGNLGNLPRLEGIPLPVPGNALLERTPGIAEMEVRQLGGDSLFRVPYDSWILIPLRPGVVNIPTAEYRVDELTRRTPPLRIEVRGLPEEVKTSRAVGDFSYTSEIRQKSMPMGGDLVLVQELKGTGNFPYLRFPEVEFNGFVLMSQDVENNFKPTIGGYAGTKRVLTRLTPQKAGVQSVLLPGFSWMTPETEKVYTVPVKNQEVTVLSSPEALKSPGDEIQILGWTRILREQPWQFYREPWSLIVILPGLIILVLVLLKPLHGRTLVTALLPFLMAAAPGTVQEPEDFQQAGESFKAGNYKEAKGYFEGLLGSQPENPAILYNMALCSFKENALFETLQDLRRSLGSGGMLPEAQLLLGKLENSGGLQDQWPVAPVVPPVIFWVVTVMALNGLLVVTGFWIRSRKAKTFSWGMLLLVGTLTAGVTYASLLGYQDGPAGVVGTVLGKLQRVPGEKAESWMTLSGGTSVRIIGSSYGYSLVQTGYGLEGWMQDELILRTDRNYFSR